MWDRASLEALEQLMRGPHSCAHSALLPSLRACGHKCHLGDQDQGGHTGSLDLANK